MKNEWSEYEINYLIENYSQFGAKKIADDLNRSINTVRKKASYFNLKFNNIPEKYKKNEFEKIVYDSKNYRDILKKLKMTITGNNVDTIKKYIQKYEIKISHFIIDSKIKSKIDLDKILIENSKYTHTTNLKNKLYVEGLKEKKCEMCGQDEIWNGKKMSLILDHINGVNNDNRIENLRIVCPNCNATLDTHCRGYIGLLNKENKKIKKRNRQHLRIVNRPSYEILIQDINSLGYCGTGRKYGVSDNSIRKWVKSFEMDIV
jgi:hypothetical protein